MKTKGYYLSLGVVVAILCVPALSLTESSPGLDKPFLNGQFNPALTGIGQLYVELSSDTRISHVAITELQDIHQKVERRLDKANIKIISRPFLDSRLVYSLTDVKPSRIAKLRIDTGTLRIEDSQQCVFRIQTSLVREVYLSEDQTLPVRADVWKAEPVMQAVSVKDMPSKVTDAVLGQVEGFIRAYKATNSQGRQASDARTSETDSLAAAEKQIEPAAKSAVAEYGYVASKNSKVFHKPECRWVKRIKPENLVGYSSKNEAINVGKRPCKQCKP
ncbi:MAG TPA: Ada metal-binding domain-containing protein [Sedimentisphaerales bacterium]|nr:Ada metal-binding domain-containing protein [Sedimentisphaerales bacterium]